MISATDSAPQAASKSDASVSEWPVELTKGGAVVRIFKCVLNTGYNFFQVAYYQDGVRKRETIKDEAEARARARAVLASLAGGEVEAASMRLQDVRSYEAARNLLKPTGVTLETACREYADAHALLRGASLLHVVEEYAARQNSITAERTIEQVVDGLLAAKAQGRSTRLGGKATRISDKYLTQLRLRLERFEKTVSGPIKDVSSKDLNEFLDGLKDPQDKPVSGRTRNNYLESIKILFHFAMKERYVPRDTTILHELERAEDGDFEIEIYTPEELKQLLAAASERLLPVLVIGAFAGLRYAELTRLDWSDIKRDAKHIEVAAKKAKTRSRRLVPISRNLAAWLAQWRNMTGPVWPCSEPYLSECLCDTARAAKMAWKHNALRHSFISYRVAQIKNVHEVSLEAGNSPDIIFQHYREVVTKKQAAEWFAITPALVEEFRQAHRVEGSSPETAPA